MSNYDRDITPDYGLTGLPRTVPQDPEAVERERAVRELQKKLEEIRDSETPIEAGRRIGREVLGTAPSMQALVDALFTPQSDCHGFEPPSDADILGDLGVCEVKIMRVRPGDVLVLHSDRRIAKPAFERIKSLMKERFPDNEVILFEKGIRVSVARQDSYTERTEPIKPGRTDRT